MTVLPKHKPSLPGWRGASPLTIDGLKKHFCYPLERKIIAEASREHTWIRGANSRHTVPCSLEWIPADGHEAESSFCLEARALCRLRGPPVPALYHSVLGEGGKGWTQTN